MPALEALQTPEFPYFLGAFSNRVGQRPPPGTSRCPAGASPRPGHRATGRRAQPWPSGLLCLRADPASGIERAGRSNRVRWSSAPAVCQSPSGAVASHQRCNSGVGVGSFKELSTHEGDLRPYRHEYRPQKLSAPTSTSCSARAAGAEPLGPSRNFDNALAPGRARLAPI